MKPIDTEKLLALVNSGHELDPTTVRSILNRLADYQNNPRSAGPGLQLPEVRPARDQVIAYTEYLIGNGQYWNDNPILDVIQKQARELAEQAARRGFIYDPTSLQLQVVPEEAGNRVRFTALAKYKEQS